MSNEVHPKQPPATAELSIPQALEIALAHHQAGRLREAQGLYRQILQIAPDTPQALHLSGVAAHQTGDQQTALALIGRAIALAPSAPMHCNLGAVLQALGRLVEAEDCYRQAITLQADCADAHYNLGKVHQLRQQNDAAISCYRQAISAQPEHVGALNDLGNLLRKTGDCHAALACFAQALRIKPDYAQALCNQGVVLRKLQRFDEALASYAQALAIAPDFIQAWHNQGNALRDCRRFEEALACYRQVLRLNPDFIEALNSVGNSLVDLQQPEAALAYFDRALALDPAYLDALCNRGNALRHLHRHAEALACYAEAQTRHPGNADAPFNESLCRLLLGDLAGAWQKYEWRWHTAGQGPLRQIFQAPRWPDDCATAAMQGKTILLHAEQGLGDTIQFCRYAPLVAERLAAEGAQGARVLLEVQEPLAALLARLPGVAGIAIQGQPLPAFDYHCPLLSLPRAFHTTLETIPAQRGYLQSDPACVAAWQARLGRAEAPPAKPRIGLVWSGGAQYKSDHFRSMPLATMLPLVTAHPLLRFVSLQNEVRAADRPLLDGHGGIADFTGEINGFELTAGLLANLDLLITVDTSAAHLAGALGLPVWILLAYNPHCLWLLQRSDSPWYPTARLFRQARPGDWDGVIAEVGDALSARYAACRT